MRGEHSAFSSLVRGATNMTTSSRSFLLDTEVLDLVVQLVKSKERAADQATYALESFSKLCDALTGVLKGIPVVVTKMNAQEAQIRILQARLNAVESSWRNKKSVPHSRQNGRNRRGVATQPAASSAVTQPITVEEDKNVGEFGGKFNSSLHDQLKTIQPSK